METLSVLRVETFLWTCRSQGRRTFWYMCEKSFGAAVVHGRRREELERRGVHQLALHYLCILAICRGISIGVSKRSETSLMTYMFRAWTPSIKLDPNSSHCNVLTFEYTLILFANFFVCVDAGIPFVAFRLNSPLSSLVGLQCKYVTGHFQWLSSPMTPRLARSVACSSLTRSHSIVGDIPS